MSKIKVQKFHFWEKKCVQIINGVTREKSFRYIVDAYGHGVRQLSSVIHTYELDGRGSYWVNTFYKQFPKMKKIAAKLYKKCPGMRYNIAW